MQECTISGLFPESLPIVVARQILRELAHRSFIEFQCAPSETEINRHINGRFKREKINRRCAIQLMVSPEEALNTMSSRSIVAYEDPDCRKRKFSSGETRSLKTYKTQYANTVCQICQQSTKFKVRSRLECGCTFHMKCIKQSMEEWKTICPICSHPITI
jgi:hypothetical protein